MINYEPNFKDVDFLDIDLLNKTIQEIYKNNKKITLFAIMDNKKPGLSNGQIINIIDDNFIYKFNQSQKFSEGFIIINQLNNSIIGIHKKKIILQIKLEKIKI